MKYPVELKYTENHEWIRMEGNVGVVGITDFAQSELGDIIYVDLKAAGTEYAKDEVFGSIEAVKTVSDLFMPLAGKVVEVNDAINDDASVVNTDPYGAGWMVKIEISNPDEVSGLMDADAYESMVG